MTVAGLQRALDFDTCLENWCSHAQHIPVHPDLPHNLIQNHMGYLLFVLREAVRSNEPMPLRALCLLQAVNPQSLRTCLTRFLTKPYIYRTWNVTLLPVCIYYQFVRGRVILTVNNSHVVRQQDPLMPVVEGYRWTLIHFLIVAFCLCGIPQRTVRLLKNTPLGFRYENRPKRVYFLVNMSMDKVVFDKLWNFFQWHYSVLPWLLLWEPKTDFQRGRSLVTEPPVEISLLKIPQELCSVLKHKWQVVPFFRMWTSKFPRLRSLYGKDRATQLLLECWMDYVPRLVQISWML